MQNIITDCCNLTFDKFYGLQVEFPRQDPSGKGKGKKAHITSEIFLDVFVSPIQSLTQTTKILPDASKS